MGTRITISKQGNKKCEHQAGYESNQEKCIFFYDQHDRGCDVKEKGETQVQTGNNLSIVYQNIRSLWGTCGELEILLETEINNVEVLCFTEHWLNCHKLYAININHFTLANAFCIRNSEHGGS